MKKNILILVFALSSVIMINSCGDTSKEKKSTTKEVASGEYTCPMHSEVKSNEPGKCPKCGMDLVQKNHD